MSRGTFGKYECKKIRWSRKICAIIINKNLEMKCLYHWKLTYLQLTCFSLLQKWSKSGCQKLVFGSRQGFSLYLLLFLFIMIAFIICQLKVEYCVYNHVRQGLLDKNFQNWMNAMNGLYLKGQGPSTWRWIIDLTGKVCFIL